MPTLKTFTYIFIAALLIIAKEGKQPKYLSVDGKIKCAIYIHWNMT